MKNSKGFTLIELLAVLILISIIVVISMPKILNVIEQSKIKAYEQSSNSISDAAKFKQNSEFYENGEFTSDYSFAGGNYADKSEKLPFKGDTPYSGMLHLNKSGETALAFLFKDNKNYYCVTKNYNDKKSSGTKIKTGNDCSITLPEGLVLSAEMDEIEEFVQVDDPNPGVICGDEKEENYSGVNECHIKSVEDFVELSVLVNSGKDFNGKNVVLDNDIDFNNDLSYINPNSTNFGDFNEDGVTESIKKEVSESYGFQPIGNNTKNFKGVFLGNNNKIKGIYINRTEQDYVGLFGFVSGNIKNVSIESANVKGKNYVGTLAGKLSGINSNGFTVNNLNVSGSGSIGSIFGDAPKVLSIYAENVNVKGDTSVGGIIGNGGYSKYSDSVIIKNSTVTGTTNTKMISGGQYGSVKNYLAVNVTNSNVSGNSYVGGVYGAARTLSYVTIDNVNVKGDTSVGGIVGNVGSSKYTSNTVMKNSMVTGTTYTKAINGGQYGSSRNYLLLNIKLNNEDVSNSTTDTINDINTYEVAGIDTYIGGDNDNTGYYFDYNNQNKIVIKNTEDNPIVQLENGTGTKENPYLISSEEDWKKASATSTTSDTYFKLTKDLDFSNKKFYMLGSKNNEFKGTLDGNGKKISNLSINVPKVSSFDYVGIIGKGGSAYGINLDNIKVTGYNYVGALFGSTRGTVRDIYASNLNISGNNYIGGIGGDINTNSPRPTSMIISANVEGNSYVGITTGSSYLGIEQIAIIGGSVKGSSYVGRLSGNTVSWNDTYALETIPNGNGGKNAWKTISSDANLSDLSLYKDMNIDTSLTGDTDGLGYYFDVDKNGNIFVTK